MENNANLNTTLKISLSYSGNAPLNCLSNKDLQIARVKIFLEMKKLPFTVKNLNLKVNKKSGTWL